MTSILAPAIPEYAHPIHRGVDGIAPNRIHGPRTEFSAKRRAGYARLYMDIMADRTAQSFEGLMAETNR